MIPALARVGRDEDAKVRSSCSGDTGSGSSMELAFVAFVEYRHRTAFDAFTARTQITID
jgi:hypothetical protein